MVAGKHHHHHQLNSAELARLFGKMARVEARGGAAQAGRWLLILVAMGCVGLLALVATLGPPGAPEGAGMLQKAKGGGEAAAGGSAVNAVLKKQLQHDLNIQEGRLYAAALKKGGISLDQRGEQAVETEVASAKKTPASLAVDERLQKNVQLASEIAARDLSAASQELASASRASSKLAHAKHVVHSHLAASTADRIQAEADREDAARLQLASQILANAGTVMPAARQAVGHAEHRGAEPHPHPVAAVDQHHVVAAHAVEQKKKPALTASQRIERGMVARLNEKLRSREASLYNKDVQARIKKHPDLAALAPHSAAADKATAVERSNRQLARALRNDGVLSGGHRQQLAGAPAQAHKGGKGGVSNMQLEAAMRAQLDDHVHALERRQQVSLMGHHAKARAQHAGAARGGKGTDKTIPSNMALELALRNELNHETSLMLHGKKPQSAVMHLRVQSLATSSGGAGAQHAAKGGKVKEQHSEEYKMEGLLRKELDESVSTMEKKDYVKSRLLAMEHPKQASEQFQVQLHSGSPAAKKGGSHITEMGMEKILRGQLNAAVQQKERQQFAATAKLAVSRA